MGETCEDQLHKPIDEDVCDKMRRIHSCFIVFLVFKGLSIFFNAMALYAGGALIFKHGAFNPLVGGRLNESNITLLDESTDNRKQQEML